LILSDNIGISPYKEYLGDFEETLLLKNKIKIRKTATIEPKKMTEAPNKWTAASNKLT